MLVGLSESGTRPSFQTVTGISAGALLAPFVFLGSEYDPVLKKIATVEQSDIYIKRPFLAAFVSDSVNDTTPLKRLIATYMDEAIMARIAEEYRRGRALVIITTDLDAGVQVVWDIGAIAESGHPQALALIRKIMLASAAIPGGFPPVMFDVNVDGVARQEMHVDGGAISQTFLYPTTVPIGKLNLAGARRARTAYIVRNGHLREDWTEVEKSSIAIALRSVSTLTTSSGVGDLFRIYATTKRDGIAFKLAYIRDDFLEPHPSEFDPTTLRSFMNMAAPRLTPAMPGRASRRASPSARPRLIGKLFQYRPQRPRRGDALREEQPQRIAAVLQFDAFRIDAGAAPVAFGCAEQFGGVEPASLGVVRVHMRDRAGLRLDERGRVRQVGEDIFGAKVDDAAEAGDQMCALDLHPVEREIAKARELLRLRMTPQIGARGRGVSILRACPDQHHARALQRVAFLALVSISDTRLSASRFLVWIASVDSSISGEPAASVATLTNEQ